MGKKGKTLQEEMQWYDSILLGLEKAEQGFCEIMETLKTDPQSLYTPFYWRVLKNLQDVQREKRNLINLASAILQYHGDTF